METVQTTLELETQFFSKEDLISVYTREDAIRDGFFVAQGQNLQNPPTTATLLLPNRA